jgi:hypothetical protein
MDKDIITKIGECIRAFKARETVYYADADVVAKEIVQMVYNSMSEIDGKTWFQGRKKFVEFATRYREATKDSEQRIAADAAPKQIWLAMLDRIWKGIL